MGRRGPAPKRLDGKGGIDGRPTKPAWLKGDAAKLWPQVLRNLSALGTLSKSDALPIARYCRNFTAKLKADDQAEQYGDLIVNKTQLTDDQFKSVVTHARRKRMQSLALEKALVQFERDFGLSPASRANLNVTLKPIASVASRPRVQMPMYAPEHAR